MPWASRKGGSELRLIRLTPWRVAALYHQVRRESAIRARHNEHARHEAGHVVVSALQASRLLEVIGRADIDGVHDARSGSASREPANGRSTTGEQRRVMVGA